MLHFDYQKPGSQIDLPEVAGHAGTKNTRFELVSTHPGGMGVCYHLRSEETGTDYALKCIHPRLLGGADSLNRFRDELEIWLAASACDAVTEAIAIVRINDIPSMLAPWMTGGDLANARASLRPEQKTQVILRVVRGLQWVKDKLGVIHRDLKPSNILLDANGNGSIADWGLARPAKAAMREAVSSPAPQQIERPDRTQQGSFMGTVLYASPEQIIDAASVDHRSDIYALGCIMFEMEVGIPPFSGKNSQEIAKKHLYEIPPKLGGFLKKTHLGLETVIQRCLAKQPSQRYASYAELEKAVTLVAMGRGFSIHTCRVAERYRRFQLGKGHVAQEHLIEKAAAIGNEVALLKFEHVRPYLEEATNLMALRRYQEAEVILREYYIPDVLTSGPTWHSRWASSSLALRHF